MCDDSEYFDTPELPIGVRLVLTMLANVGDAVMAVLRVLEPED